MTNLTQMMDDGDGDGDDVEAVDASQNSAPGKQPSKNNTASSTGMSSGGVDVDAEPTAASGNSLSTASPGAIRVQEVGL